MSLLRPYMVVPTPEPGHCANCRAPLSEPLPKFCGACGQETKIKAPTLWEFLQQFGGAYISTEGALWRTLWRLLLLPGQLTLEYFAGRRRHYVLPVRLYLTISVLALVLLKLTSHLELDEKAAQGIMQLDRSEKREVRIGILDSHAFGLHEGKFFCEGLPDFICQRAELLSSSDNAAIARQMRELPARFVSHLGSAMFLLLPAYAFWLKLIYFDKRRRYTEHLVCSLHLHSFWFAMLALIVSGSGLLTFLAVLGAMIYPVIALHRVYATRWWSTGWRVFSVAILYLTTLTMVLMLLGIYAALT
ncbi:DUF3667 domain-containing protein [Paucibacter sp. APW11]|uniref:DUF3667 domain-containing protein n=2 Tax=Roseateles aquae TaxID=3077235 RepID=A0ABU3P7Y2_9BURK|nr:DUF3667 domain-containing protein [Paucibacter sp. APW11]